MMDFFYLIPIALVLGGVGLATFLWTLRDGQYEDLDGAAERILFDDAGDSGRAAPSQPDEPDDTEPTVDRTPPIAG